MQSAFGVDHGDYDEIAKLGNPFTALGTGLGTAGRFAAKKVGQGANKIGPGMGPLTRGQSAMKGATIGAGKGLKKAGNFALRRPGLTGGVAAGGGAAGLGGGAALLNRNRNQ